MSDGDILEFGYLSEHRKAEHLLQTVCIGHRTVSRPAYGDRNGRQQQKQRSADQCAAQVRNADTLRRRLPVSEILQGPTLRRFGDEGRGQLPDTEAEAPR